MSVDVATLREVDPEFAADLAHLWARTSAVLQSRLLVGWQQVGSGGGGGGHAPSFLRKHL